MRNKLGCIKIVSLLLLLYALPLSAQAQEHDLLDLYRLAKVKDPDVGRAAARLETGHADKDIAWAAIIPRVEASGTVRQLWHNVVDYEGSGPTSGQYTGYSYGVGARFPLFAMSSYYQISAAAVGVKSALSGVEAAEQDLIVRLVDAYIKILKAAADQQLYRDEYARVGKIMDQIQAFLSAGTGDIIAVYEARARMDNAAADLVKAEGQLRLAEQNLAALTGVKVEVHKELTAVTAGRAEPNDIEWWIDTMQQRSPSLNQAREDLRQSEEYRKAAGSGHFPTVQVTGGYTVDKGSTFLPKVETQQWYVGASAAFPIYSGGDTSARVRRAMAGQSERRAILNGAQDQAIKRVKEIFLNLQYNLSLVEAYQRKNESAELQLKAVKKGHSIGTRTAIDLLNAEQTYAVSNRDLTAALYDNHLRRIELKAAAGILSENDLMELNSLLIKKKI